MTSEPDSPFDAMLREAAALRVPAADAAHLPELGELLQQKYRIDAQLGAGGMGAVFRATNVENGKQVAIKWLLGSSSKACARFVREGRVAAQIDHPNVVNVFDLGTHRGGHFLVMELLRGESMGSRVRVGRLSARELVAIMLPVLRGVRAAHAAGVIHRDLKPDNVFLCLSDDGTPREPKVLDFGIAKLCARADSRAAMLQGVCALNERLTSEGTGLGTLAYMSPEQLVDAPNVDARSDIYAAGVMMYEGLTGRLPFQAENHNALVLAIAAQRPLSISLLVPGIESGLERTVMRAMAKEPSDRHADVQALLGDLAGWLHEAGSIEARASATPSAKAEPVGQETLRRAAPGARGLLWAAVLVAAAACVIFITARSARPGGTPARLDPHASTASLRRGSASSEPSERDAPALSQPTSWQNPQSSRAQPNSADAHAAARERDQTKEAPLSANSGGRSGARAASRAGALRLSDL